MTVVCVSYYVYEALIAANHNTYSKSTKTVHPRNHKRGNISFRSPSKTYVKLKYLKLKQNFTQCRLVVCCRRFGTTYRSHLEGSSSPPLKLDCLTIEYGTNSLSRNVGNKLPSATSRTVAGSIPDGVIGIFHCHNPSGRTMAPGLTQPLTEMSTRNISWG